MLNADHIVRNTLSVELNIRVTKALEQYRFFLNSVHQFLILSITNIFIFNQSG